MRMITQIAIQFVVENYEKNVLGTYKKYIFLVFNYRLNTSLSYSYKTSQIKVIKFYILVPSVFEANIKSLQNQSN